MITIISKALVENITNQLVSDDSLNKKFKNYFSPKENKFVFPENIKEKIGYLSLDERIKAVKPFLPDSKIQKLKGDIGEKTMDMFFKNSKWSKIEGQVGNHGIDGLYIKRDKNKNVKQILAVESKYNKSKPGNTLDGKQMSRDWIIAKIDNLIVKYPDNKDYLQIKELVLQNKYRRRFFHINEINGKLQIKISKIEDNGDKDIKIKDLKGNEQMKINSVKEIDMQNTQNKYEENIVNNYLKNVNDVINNKKEQHG